MNRAPSVLVPLTATPAYRLEAGQLLLQSAHPGFRDIGQQMLDSLAATEPS